MSGLISPLLWQSIPFGTPNAFLDFGMQHQSWHQELAKQTATRFVLMDDLKENLSLHAQVHDDLAAAYGVSPVGDLQSFDLNDEVSWTAWHFLHSLDHTRFQQASGL